MRSMSHTQLLLVWSRWIGAHDLLPTALLFVPCLWGLGFAVTRALLRHGADPAAVCAPFAPPQMVLLLGLACLLARPLGAAVWTAWTVPRVEWGVTWGQMAAVVVAHGVVLAGVGLHLSPAAVAFGGGAVALAGVSLATARAAPAVSAALRAAIPAVCVAVGFAALVGAAEAAVVAPLGTAAALWAAVVRSLAEGAQGQRGGSKAAIWGAACGAVGGLGVAGVFGTQGLPYFAALTAAALTARSAIAATALGDGLSTAAAARRVAGAGWFVVGGIVAGNVVWAIAGSYDPRRDAVDTASPALRRTLAGKKGECDAAAEEGVGTGWVDRWAYPARVQAAALGEGVVVPPWMRREYFGQNGATILRAVGAEEWAESWETFFLSIGDQYVRQV